MKMCEIHYKAVQVFSNFLGGGCLRNPLEVCTFTNYYIHPTPTKNPGYTPVGATSSFPPEEKTKRITPPTNHDGKYDDKQNETNCGNSEMQSLPVTVKRMRLRNDTIIVV